MAIFPLLEKAAESRTDLGLELRVSRPYLALELFEDKGESLPRLAMYDSGAPLSVLPYSLWYEKKIVWQILGNHLLRGDLPDPVALSWQGVPCRLGETQVRLVDQARETHSNLLRLRAKFPVAKVSSPLENEIILGQDFLAANPLSLAMRGGSGKWEGVILAE